MARGVNKAILVGRMGDDPSTKYTQGGMAVTKISLATSSVRKNKEGEQVEETQWHRVTFFGKLAEIAGEYLKKGSQVYVEGSIRYSKSTGQDGTERYYTDIIADELQMLGGRSDGDSSGGDRPARAPRENSSGGQRAGSGYGQRQAPAASSPPPMDDFDDDSTPF